MHGARCAAYVLQAQQAAIEAYAAECTTEIQALLAGDGGDEKAGEG